MKSFYLIIVACYSISQANGQVIEGTTQLIDQPALQGTIQIKTNGATATSFNYMGTDSACYLVTAKHVFKSQLSRRKIVNKKTVLEYYDTIIFKDGAKVDVEISYGGQWRKIDARLFYDNDSSDIAILKTDLPVEGNNYYFEDNVILSQDCFFLGYPLGLKQDFSKFLKNPYPLPFVKKGIISAWKQGTNGVDIYYIDASNTYGFSGGPALYYDYARKRLNTFGVVSGYLLQTNKISKSDGTLEYTTENSGIMQTWSIRYAVKILKRLSVLWPQ
ncbi:trypsin-like peptidase domain-containing protein [Panacibacter ginsenosidivorans]|uniref:Trypsin-like peptidase domain-containing protein n=1 Tax=Panacibacter ginsenosidivorans TaxID=1813871 RepID=A0A5B8VCL5_9BACT|nr:serine protease [Panacibacter ginsenosidivorans]QEC68743.1 trypsin-like peptidase domain-containing protein [Panacibacter ginsenosidivorans]